MIRAYLFDAVRRVRPVVDKYGENVSLGLTLLSARIEWGERLITDQAGQRVISQAMVLLDKKAVLLPNDYLRISSVDYPILTVQHRIDFTLRYLEVFI